VPSGYSSKGGTRENSRNWRTLAKARKTTRELEQSGLRRYADLRHSGFGEHRRSSHSAFRRLRLLFWGIGRLGGFHPKIPAISNQTRHVVVEHTEILHYRRVRAFNYGFGLGCPARAPLALIKKATQRCAAFSLECKGEPLEQEFELASTAVRVVIEGDKLAGNVFQFFFCIFG